MTGEPATLKVAIEEIRARAAELEARLRPLPDAPNSAPSYLDDGFKMRDELLGSAMTIASRLVEAQQDWADLAESLRNAAKAYENEDNDGADSVAETFIQP